MSINIISSETIPGYAPAEVFEAGILSQNLPQDERLLIEADEASFIKNVRVLAQLRLGFWDFSIDGRVTEFIPAQRLKVSGSSQFGKAALWINLCPSGKIKGTKIDYGIDLATNFFMRPFEPAVETQLNELLPVYTARYRENIVDYLGAQAISPRQ